METENTSWASDIIATAKQAQEPSQVYKKDGQVLVVVTNSDQQVSTIDLSPYQEAPARINRSIELAEVKSFVDYWQKFSNPSSIILADLETRRFKAIFDYHEPKKPAWESHSATLVCKTSTEWNTWKGSNNKHMDQIAFAEFIESNSIDIVVPAAASMKEMALTLQAKTKVDFSSGVRLDNGQVQLKYQEVIDGTAGPKGDMKIPENFTLALRVFQGGDKYEVECYLRWRIREGKLTFLYQIIRPERLLEDSFDQVKKQVETGCLGATILATG